MASTSSGLGSAADSLRHAGREVSAQASSYGGAGMDMKGQRVIIVGGVAGGASCAARLRRNNEDVEVLVLDKGPYVSFANCGLPY